MVWGLPRCIVRIKPQVPHTARQVACYPVNNSRVQWSSIPPHKTRPDFLYQLCRETAIRVSTSPDSLRPALSLGGQASPWECSPGRSLCLRKSSVRKGTPLASRVAQGVSGPSSSCVWNPRVFADDAPGKAPNHIHTTLRWGRAPGKPSRAGACWARAGTPCPTERLWGQERPPGNHGEWGGGWG